MNVLVVDINGTPHKISKGSKSGFDVLAKCSGHRYLVLASIDGELFNPIDNNHKINKRDMERGGLVWKLRTCSKECYRDYTVFLRSKNKVPHTLAQRRFRNDIR